MSFPMVGCGTEAAIAPRGGKRELPRIGDWIQTYLGVKFYPLDPLISEIRLLDIGHALSNICRFTGHVTRFYSVAQHSVLVSQNVPKKDAAWGLLHDAAEAYVSDMSRPLKRHSELGKQFAIVERSLMRAICDRFELPYDEPESVKRADSLLLMTEKRDLMPNCPAKWLETAEPLAERIIPWTPDWSRHQFMKRAGELGLFGESA